MKTLRLINPQQATTALQSLYRELKPWLFAEHRYVLTVKPETRSTAQNSRMWAMLADIANQVEWYGKKLTPTDWKHIFSASLRKLDVVPNLDGTGFVALGMSTSSMTVREMSDLIELMNSFGAEKGVKFTAPEEHQ